ncbi:hypothetical protein ACFYYH_18710 [Streptomyces sp. NPDC002018]|uniref:hypothetical protein n=1 Tax=Streptomyces sp. NPDC002018 TaxID=3364629 RepID=UPI0036910929
MNDETERTDAIRRDRWGGGYRLLGALLLLVFALWAGTGAVSPVYADDGDDLVKVFVVADTGQAATTASVAASTLGDAGRAAEIFELNRGLAQPDGGALNALTDPLRPGWILRLPEDATGPDVRLARETGSSDTADPPRQGNADAGTGRESDDGSGALTIPFAAVIAGAAAVLLALVTAGIVARRQVRGAAGAVGRTLSRLGDPVRRRRLLRFRRSLGARFAGDADSVRRAYRALEEFAGRDGTPGTPVHALRVEQAGVTAWLSPPDRAEAPWQRLDGARWRRPTGAGTWLMRGVDESVPRRGLTEDACLVRVGIDSDDEPVFVDLSRLDGVLSVSGDPGVARDVVRALLAEVARHTPGMPVTVMRAPDGAPDIPVPRALAERSGPAVPPPAPVAPAVAPAGDVTLRAAAVRRPVKGLVVMSGAPTAREAADLRALCGPGGAGWTALVCGEVDGAHWRWRTAADGRVEIPVLDLELTVPA